jgi:uncharacterized protein (TIGR00299 family) protein
MRIAYLECFSGMSGDMFLGALVDAGVPARLLEETVAGLSLGARLEIARVTRSGIAATKVDVWVDGKKDAPRDLQGEKQPGHGGEHAHSHQHLDHAHHDHAQNDHAQNDHAHEGHDHASPEHSHPEASHHEHSHGHAEGEGHDHGHGRGLREIREIISASAISDRAKTAAIAIFEALGAAEAKIHNTTIEAVHFHEVGAVDAMVDIVCAAVGFEALGVEEMICSPLNVGGGTVQCAHGTIPVPAPATVELLRGAPVYSSGVQAELVTPTGAAIVKILASRFAKFPEMKVEKSGYGAGSRDFSGHANVVRLTLGEAESTGGGARIGCDTVMVLEANLDDLNPQVFGYVMDRLLQEGALDVFGAPVMMKKNRPGTLLTVLCKPEDGERFSQIMFAETTTLGVRRREEARQILARRWESVATSWGAVRMKIAGRNGSVSNYAPEYEDCRKIAAENRVPLKTVMGEAVEAYLRSMGKTTEDSSPRSGHDSE